MRIANNIMAMNTHRQYTIQNDKVAASAEKLSSGYKINRAADDAAGLAISEKMRSQIRGLNRAVLNSQDAASLIQTAEGALQEVHSMLQRMNELAVQSATGTNQEFDRTQIAKEFDQLKREINDIAEQTTFNNMKILDGSLSNYGIQRSQSTAGIFVTNGDEFGAAVQNIMHVSQIAGSSGSTAESASFSIDLEGMSINIANVADTLTLKIGGTASVAITPIALGGFGAAGENVTDMEKIAGVIAAIGTLKVDIDGTAVEFNVTTKGSVLTFTQGTPSEISEAQLKAAVNGQIAFGIGGAGGSTVVSPTNDQIVGWQEGTIVDPGSKAINVYTFDGVLRQGDVFTFGGQRFEMVADGERPTTDGAIKVEMGTSNAAAVEALQKALTTYATNEGIDVLVKYYPAKGNALSIQQADVDVPVDLSLSMKPAEAKNGMIEFDPVKLKDGDKITVTTTDDKGNTASATYLHVEGNTMADIYQGLKLGGDRSGNYIKYDGKFVEVDFQPTQDSDSETMRIQVGALEGEQLNIEVRAMNTMGLNLDEHSIYNQDDAGKAITAVRNAVNIVSDQRALLGAMQNRMTYKINNLKISAENLQAAESRIRDVDIAAEMTKFTQANIMSQAATAMLAQANSAPQNVLSLLR